MCLITRQKVPVQIEADLIVYKKVNDWTDNHAMHGNIPGDKKSVTAIMYAFKYNIGQLYETEMKADNSFESVNDETVEKYYKLYLLDKRTLSKKVAKLTHVHEGFHAMTDPDRDCFESKSTYKCIIPKGSLIYKDATGLIVSNKIIIVEKWKNGIAY